MGFYRRGKALDVCDHPVLGKKKERKRSRKWAGDRRIYI